MKVSWYPRNFTNPDLNNIDRTIRLSDDALYATQLGLYVIGYKEFKDDKVKKYLKKIKIIKFSLKNFDQSIEFCVV